MERLWVLSWPGFPRDELIASSSSSSTRQEDILLFGIDEWRSIMYLRCWYLSVGFDCVFFGMYFVWWSGVLSKAPMQEACMYWRLIRLYENQLGAKIHIFWIPCDSCWSANSVFGHTPVGLTMIHSLVSRLMFVYYFCSWLVIAVERPN